MTTRSVSVAWPYAVTLGLSLCAGALFQQLRIPLPWMLGPLFAIGIAGVLGFKVKAIRGSRQAGQLIVGCALGLYFTAEISQQLLDYAGYIAGAAFIGIVIGAVGGALLQRIAGTATSTSFFACVPGGAAEMAILAERTGARFDQVALSHSIRVLIVVSAVPFAVTFSGAGGTDIFVPSVAQIVWPRLAELLCMAAAASLLFGRAGIPNAWLLGPLTVSAVLTMSGHAGSAMPNLLVNGAQVMIGCALGSRFKPSLRSESRQLILGIVASAGLTLVLSAALGLGIAWAIDKPSATLVLATSPGGLAEMCITAKILKLGVPLVTSFQVARLAIVVTCSLPTWRLLHALHGKMRAQ